MHTFLCMGACLEPRRGSQKTRKCNYRRFWAAMQVLEIKPRSCFFYPPSYPSSLAANLNFKLPIWFLSVILYTLEYVIQIWIHQSHTFPEYKVSQRLLLTALDQWWGYCSNSPAAVCLSHGKRRHWQQLSFIGFPCSQRSLHHLLQWSGFADWRSTWKKLPDSGRV